MNIDFVLNTFAFLIWGALIMWMCAGFTMLEAGSVRTKNASVILPEEYRPLFHCRVDLLPGRIQPDVPGRGQRHRDAELRLWGPSAEELGAA